MCHRLTATEHVMSDTSPRPDNPGEIPAQHTTPTEHAADAPPAAEPAGAGAGPVAARPSRWGGSWRDRRIPLILIAAALLLGCVLGAGVVGVGALVIGHHGDDRGYVNRDGRDGPGIGPNRNGDGRGRDERPDRN